MLNLRNVKKHLIIINICVSTRRTNAHQTPIADIFLRSHSRLHRPLVLSSVSEDGMYGDSTITNLNQTKYEKLSERPLCRNQ